MYDRLLEQDGDHPYVLFESARLAFWMGNYDVALSRLNKVLTFAPDYFPALELAAKTYLSIGRSGEAENYFQRADSKAAGKNASLTREWFYARLASGDYYGAEDLIRLLLAGKALNNDEDWLLFADVLKAEQRYAEAEGVYRQCLINAANTEQLLLGMADLRYREKIY